MNTITGEMLDALLPLLTKEQSRPGESGVSVEDARWDDPRVLNAPACQIGLDEADEWPVSVSQSFYQNGTQGIIETLAVFERTSAWIIILGDDIAGLTGYITRLDSLETETTAQFHKRWFTRLNEIVYDNIDYYY